jgi:hypothetical protein
MVLKWNFNGEYQVQTEIKIATSFKLEVVNLELFNKLDLRVLLMDANNNVIKCDNITLSGDDYKNWAEYKDGNRDEYLVKYASSFYNIDYESMYPEIV